jgi:hypothetical protein
MGAWRAKCSFDSGVHSRLENELTAGLNRELAKGSGSDLVTRL